MSTALPQLSIALAGTNVILSWPAAGSLGAGNLWTAPGLTPQVDGTNCSVILPATNNQMYYRLQGH